MVEMHIVSEPDGPLTEEQLYAVARTYYYEQLLRAGLEPGEIDGAWERFPTAGKSYYLEMVRGPVCSANAHWGRHVRTHQARLLRKQGGDPDTVLAVTAIIERQLDAVEAAVEIVNMLGLPR